MFREGHYLEIIRASDNCMATAIVTVKEKMVEIDKKKVATNKWLNLEDWSKLYNILQKAILRNSIASREQNHSKTPERKKSTSRLDIVYTFKPREDPNDVSSLPTIKVRVSPVKRKSRASTEKPVTKCEKENNKTTTIPSIISYDSPEMKLQRLLEGIESSPEEYVPSELPHRTKNRDNLKYVPSRKSFLKRMRQSPDSNSNEYTPISGSKRNSLSSSEYNTTSYIPNSVPKLEERIDEKYDPCSMSNLSSELSEAYVPSSKGSSTVIQEYEPDFGTKLIKFDDSYVPSSKIPVEISKNNFVKKKIRREKRNTKNQMQSISKKSLINNTK
ncbi:hypothetical protein PV325_012255 [Microctonus aethiopoides]|uniref:Uncharacterized protein n=2 Tax=Microctonus aethiopoides TaxID=144406 RepID=A0AA39KK74_9HYME|nr:hypothetical protein PV325_012255 [Microctonus aethiopoides]KAK0164397.1 hypothetical protein PV328_003032 [Microctonus aethiopoides]